MNKPELFTLNWFFKPSFRPEDANLTSFEGFSSVHLPHTVQELPLNYFSHDSCCLQSCYAKQFYLKREELEKTLMLVFEGVMTYYDLYINGKHVLSHKGGYSESEADITEYCAEGRNTLVMMVDSTERADIPPFGYVVDYLTFGGIYREVWLHKLETSHIRHAFARYTLEEGKVRICPELTIHSRHGEPDCELEWSVWGPDGNCVCNTHQSLSLKKGGACYSIDEMTIENPQLWALDTPRLYKVKLTLHKAAQLLDTHEVRTGFRSIRCTAEGLFVNGEKTKIVGLNRHQSYPYVGYAMGKRPQQRDAEILKNYLGVNTVRTSHYMQSRHFLDRCDELGLLVFSEIPGWGHIGDEAFKEVVMQDVLSMITTQHHHPSVFIWGVRLNESLDDDALYTKTNTLARKLDSSRPTTGVRYIEKSNLLEDVYAMNDFTYYGPSEGGQKIFRSQHEVTGNPTKVPYLVSEFSGTTFHCKPWDDNYRRANQARLFAKAVGQANLSPDMLGAIGWCAFDYNTHGDFGAGDKICYHGVMDIFRMPKYSAQFYRSQKNPQQEIVMEPATQFSRNDNKDTQLAIPFMVLTNCDYIEVEMYGKEPVRFYPSTQYPGLAHPPIEVENDWGRWYDKWQDGKVSGYYQGKKVAEKPFARDAYFGDLRVVQEDIQLQNERVDEGRFTCCFVDQVGNEMTYYPGMLQIETEGDIEVVGPSLMAVMGGKLSFWVKTKATQVPQTAQVHIRVPGNAMPEKHFAIQLLV